MAGNEFVIPSSKFSIADIDRFNIQFPYFREPTELGTFCLDGSRNYVPGNGQTKYLYMPKQPDKLDFDLSAGYESAVKKDFNYILKENLDNLLKWIHLNRKTIPRNDPNSVGFAADFVCYRGLLTVLLCTPYEQKDPWIICATKYQGSIYLCQFETEKKKLEEENISDRGRLMCSWGYKFEQYLTTTVKGRKPDTDIPVNENEEFCCVVRTRLGNHSLIYGAELDCVDPSVNSRGMQRFVELKTSRIITSPYQERSFRRFKLMKWWAQSFLIGIRQIICGNRNDSGIVHRIQTYNVASIPKITKDVWKPNVCMSFCEQFLAYIKTVVQKDDASAVYKFELHPGLDITWEELYPHSSFQFIPSDTPIVRIGCTLQEILLRL